VNHVQLIEDDCWSKIDRLYGASFLDERLYDGEAVHVRARHAQVVTSITSRSKEKGGTYRDTLDLQRQGKTAEEIAVIRGLSVGTIKSHLARWISSGEIDVYEVLPEETINPVLAFLREHEGATTTAIRNGTGDRFDYNDIRMIVAHSSCASARAGREK
jgi:uncharacterized protein YpbB